MTDTPLLELRGVSKHFGAVIALHEVDFKVYPGCVTALVGDNGAGKSTLIKSVAGIYRIDNGEIIYDGKPVHVSGPRDAADLGIEVVYQDLALAKGKTPTAKTVPIDNGTHKVPSILEKPVSVTKDNIADYFGNPDFPTKADICAGKVKANCDKLGL